MPVNHNFSFPFLAKKVNAAVSLRLVNSNNIYCSQGRGISL